jgi:hypothetical protein
MFGTVLTTFYTLILLYLLWRTASVPFIVRTVVPRMRLFRRSEILHITLRSPSSLRP